MVAKGLRQASAGTGGEAPRHAAKEAGEAGQAPEKAPGSQAVDPLLEVGIEEGCGENQASPGEDHRVLVRDQALFAARPTLHIALPFSTRVIFPHASYRLRPALLPIRHHEALLDNSAPPGVVLPPPPDKKGLLSPKVTAKGDMALAV